LRSRRIVAVLGIRQFGDPVLRQKAASIEVFDAALQRLAADMHETLDAAGGVGLAGPQVGVLRRIFVWATEDERGTICNPTITFRSPKTFVEDEGCLSIPGLYYPLERHQRVTVVAQDEFGDPIEVTGDGLLARCLQHEIDHLDGVLFLDRLPEELRKDALRALREQALGLSPRPRQEQEAL
jgi:peptide deformylase